MRKPFKTIVADPPWLERGGGRIKRGSDRHYKLMKTADIASLPVEALVGQNAHLYLWATNNFLPDALKVMEAWGFRYITDITWAKGLVMPTGELVLDKPGLGQYFRGLTEHCLFGVRGVLPYRTLNGKRAQGTTLIIHPRMKHSEKPHSLLRMVERVSPGPYVELFSRQRRPGWICLGDHLDNKPLDMAIRELRRAA